MDGERAILGIDAGLIVIQVGYNICCWVVSRRYLWENMDPLHVLLLTRSSSELTYFDLDLVPEKVFETLKLKLSPRPWLSSIRVARYFESACNKLVSWFTWNSRDARMILIMKLNNKTVRLTCHPNLGGRVSLNDYQIKTSGLRTLPLPPTYSTYYSSINKAE